MMHPAEIRSVLTLPRGFVMAFDPKDPIKPPRVKIETTRPN